MAKTTLAALILTVVATGLSISGLFLDQPLGVAMSFIWNAVAALLWFRLAQIEGRDSKPRVDDR